MIINHDPVVRHFVQRMLLIQGYDCEEAQHDEHVMEQIRTDQPRLIIADCKKSTMKGIHFLKSMANQSSCRSIPLILLRSTDDPILYEGAMELGVYAVLEKPLDYRQISVAVASVFAD